MNRGQLRLRLQQMIGLDDEAGEEEETLANDLLNEAIIDIKMRTRLSMKCLDITIAAGSDLFKIPDSVLQMDGLYDDEGTRWLKVAPDLIDDTGEFALIGEDRVKLLEADEDRIFMAYYVPFPTPMTQDTHDPADETYGGIPTGFHQAILHYACWKAANAIDDSTAQMGEEYRVWYEGKEPGGVGGDIARIRRWTNTRITPSGRRRPTLDGYTSTSYV